MAINDYTAAARLARLRTLPGEELEGSRVYYQAHKVTGPFYDRAAYSGKWQGKAVSLDGSEDVTKRTLEEIRNGLLEPPEGLSADLIGYACDDRPEAPHIFQMTGQHRGQRGFVSGNVYCIILRSYVFIR